MDNEEEGLYSTAEAIGRPIEGQDSTCISQLLSKNMTNVHHHGNSELYKDDWRSRVNMRTEIKTIRRHVLVGL